MTKHTPEQVAAKRRAIMADHESRCACERAGINPEAVKGLVKAVVVLCKQATGHDLRISKDSGKPEYATITVGIEAFMSVCDALAKAKEIEK